MYEEAEIRACLVARDFLPSVLPVDLAKVVVIWSDDTDAILTALLSSSNFQCELYIYREKTGQLFDLQKTKDELEKIYENVNNAVVIQKLAGDDYVPGIKGIGFRRISEAFLSMPRPLYCLKFFEQKQKWIVLPDQDAVMQLFLRVFEEKLPKHATVDLTGKWEEVT